MSTQMFALGKAPRKSSVQRRKERIRKELNKTIRLRVLRRGETLTLHRAKPEHWRLFPRTIDVGLSFLFDFNDSCLTSLVRSVQEYPFKTFGQKRKRVPLMLPCSPASALFQTNQRIRFFLKAFINKVRLRKFKIANEVDPVTFEPPVNVIKVIDWAQKKMYQFEAASLLGDIRTRLQNHDYLFPEPLLPRNMVTNLPFTLFQTITVYQQLLKLGYMHWTLECLRHAEYNLPQFSLLNHKQLSLKALYQSVYNDNDKEILLDFIELQHHYHSQLYDSNLYQWVVTSKSCQHLKKLDTWKKYCYEYHSITILYEDTDEQVRLLNRVSYSTSELCKSGNELRELKAMVVS